MSSSISQAVEKRQEQQENSPIQAAANWVLRNQESFSLVLPTHIKADQWTRLAVGALRRDEKLAIAAMNNPAAFGAALLDAARKGLEPGTEEYYLTPRRKNGRQEILGIEGYRGIVERMYRSGAVASVIVREVCENDEFEFTEGVHDKPQHKINWFGGERGAMIGVYAYAILTTGAVSRVVILSRGDVMAAKAKSDAAKSEYSPWNAQDGGPEHPEFQGRSMWWKTAVRRLEPWVPTSNEFRKDQLRAAAEVADERAARASLTVTTHAPAGPPGPQPVIEDVDGELVTEGSDDAPAGVDAETGEIAETAPGSDEPSVSRRTLAQLRGGFRDAKITEPDEQLQLAGTWTGREGLADLSELTVSEGASVAAELAKLKAQS